MGFACTEFYFWVNLEISSYVPLIFNYSFINGGNRHFFIMNDELNFI